MPYLRILSIALCCGICLGVTRPAKGVFTLLDAFNQSAGARDSSSEIISFSPHQSTVLSTMSSGVDGYGVQILTLSNAGTLSERGIVTFNNEFGGPGNLAGVSSTAIDPLQRGFAAVALIPTANGTTNGKVAFFDYRNGTPDVSRPIATVDVGFHPDSITFSPDGTKLFVANEGEYTSGGATDAPGSVSIIDLTSISAIGDVAAITNSNVVNIDFTAGNLGAGVSIAGLRFNDNTPGAVANRERHVEPEYMAFRDGKLYVTLQENNAIGVLTVDDGNLANSEWSAIHSLGTITNTIDASDRDGAGNTKVALIDDVVKGLPMPDAFSIVEINGQKYIVTANEGDFRVDDGDRKRVKDFAGLEVGFSANTADSALGRLRVSVPDSDPDGNNLLDDIIMPGTRSFSIWNADTGALVSDSGSLEGLLLSLDPLKHNIEVGDLGTFDERSPNKGPEPEALTVGTINGRPILFIGMERQNGLLAYDLSDPNYPVFLDYFNDLDIGLISPESMAFISAELSPTGIPLLLVGYEEVGGGIGVFSFLQTPAPEPSSLALSCLGLLLMRRRKVSRTR